MLVNAAEGDKCQGRFIQGLGIEKWCLPVLSLPGHHTRTLLVAFCWGMASGVRRTWRHILNILAVSHRPTTDSFKLLNPPFPPL